MRNELIFLAVVSALLVGCGDDGGTDQGSGQIDSLTINNTAGGDIDQTVCIVTIEGVQAQETVTTEFCGQIGGIPLNDADVAPVGLTEGLSPDAPIRADCSPNSQLEGACQLPPSSDN